MSNSKVIGGILIVGASLFSSAAVGQELLTGDTRLACEAVLCLSSPARPGECAPSLARYFGISFKKWSDTVKGRLDFLNLCPASSDQSQNMPSLVKAISQGAGRCDSEFLNQHNTKEILVRERDSEGYWVMVPHQVISNTKPHYCTQYQEHQYAYQLASKYIGTEETGGFWAEQKDYERKLAEYNVALEKKRVFNQPLHAR